LTSSRRLFWKVRVAQGSMARCAVHLEMTGFISGIGGLRRMAWRDAPIENLKSDCIT
ncbi:hypothetical protein A2U01_0090729, partial [Trifolium medium]|nr:hypothetical protein [Trifolium medium]